MFRTITKFPNGKEPEFTFFTDFDIAAHFGKKAILDTYKNVIREWGDDYKAMTEVVMSINCLCWDYYENGNMEISGIFSDLYYESRDFFYDTFENDNEALHHYFEMTN